MSPATYGSATLASGVKRPSPAGPPTVFSAPARPSQSVPLPASQGAFGQLLAQIEPRQLYRTKDVARILSCSVRYVQLLVELGRLEALRVGRLIRIPGDELLRFVEQHMQWGRE